MRRRHELTDEQWTRIEGLLPGRAGNAGRHGVDNRLFVDAVFYVAKTGIPWRDLPERFGNWNSVWRRFDRWCKTDVWSQVAQALSSQDLEELLIDSTIIRAQQSAAGSRRKPLEKRKMPTADAALDNPGEDEQPRSTRL